MHGDVLGQREWAVWDRVVSAGLLSGFYLGGGTAAALHLGHCLSHDLDWFTPAGFPGEVGGATSTTSMPSVTMVSLSETSSPTCPASSAPGRTSITSSRA